MGNFMAVLLGGLFSLITPAVKQVLISLGIGAVTYTGVKVLLDSLISQMNSFIGGLPADILNYMNLCGFADVISIITSAVSIRLTLQHGLGGDGSIKRWSKTS